MSLTGSMPAPGAAAVSAVAKADASPVCRLTIVTRLAPSVFATWTAAAP